MKGIKGSPSDEDGASKAQELVRIKWKEEEEEEEDEVKEKAVELLNSNRFSEIAGAINIASSEDSHMIG